ncbi:hypothetical protein BpHYR1_007821, partial [Brachionus plicatilis]
KWQEANLVFNGENMSYEEFYNAFGYDAAMYMWNGAVSKVEEHGTMLVSVINLSDEDAQFRQDFEFGEWEEAEILPVLPPEAFDRWGNQLERDSN